MLATVGYGDIVPHTAWGRVLGSVVIIVGVTFRFFSLPRSRRSSSPPSRKARPRRANGRGAAGDQATQALLHELAARLEAIEGKLDALTRNPKRRPATRRYPASRRRFTPTG
jgi:hypothetical protein